MEIADKEPWFVEGLRHTGEQIKGACLVPKRALDVMSGEVNRVLQMANTSIIPITWQVPRKSYRDYHADIYPDTPGPEAAMGPENWLGGANIAPAKISLDPAKRPASMTKFGPPVAELPRHVTPPPASSNGLNKSNGHSNGSSGNGHSNPSSNGNGHSSNGHMSPSPSPRARVSRCNSEAGQPPSLAPRPSPRPVSVQMGPPTSAAPRPKTSVTSIGSESGDETDNFKRQPSIRDRMKMFETMGVEKTAETPGLERSVSSAASVPGARMERRLDLESENKENKPEPVTVIEIKDQGKVDNEAFLRPKSRCDKNEPFLMPQQRPLHGGSPTLGNNRTSKFGRVTKFKHMKGTPMHKSMHFENLKNLSKSVPADCDIIQVSQLISVNPMSHKIFDPQ